MHFLNKITVRSYSKFPVIVLYRNTASTKKENGPAVLSTVPEKTV